MAATPAITALRAAGIDVREHSYRHDPRAASFGEEAAAALGVDAERVLKTLVIVLDPRSGSSGPGPARDSIAVAVLPVSHSLDLRAAAAAFGARRAVLADPGVAERRTGYVVGGISPLGQRMPHPTVIDVTAVDHDTVFVSAGRRGLELELDPADLVRLTAASLAPIAA